MNAGKLYRHAARNGAASFRFPAVFISVALHGLCFLTFYSAVRFSPIAETAPFALFFAGPAAPAEKAVPVEAVSVESAVPVESAAIPQVVHGGTADFSANLPVGGTGTLAGPVRGSASPFLNAGDLRELLRGLIEKKLVYPPLARKRNVEGKVSVLLMIGRDGRLLRSEISESSGNAILDKAARDLIDGIFPVRGISIAEIETITVSVDYNLK